jgi:hypothetical protein
MKKTEQNNETGRSWTEGSGQEDFLAVRMMRSHESHSRRGRHTGAKALGQSELI